MEKLTTKQLTNVVNAQHNHIQSIMRLVSDYIEFKGDKDKFSLLLTEKYGEPKKQSEKSD